MQYTEAYYYEDYECPQQYLPADHKTQVPAFLILLVFPLIVSAISVSTLIGFNYLAIGFGAISAAAFLLESLRTGFRFPKEVLLFGLFIIWSLLGIFKVVSLSFFTSKVFTLLQFLILFAIISHYARDTKSVYILLTASLIGILIILVSAYISGEYQRSEYTIERAAGTALNANLFALSMVYGLAIVLCFFQGSKSVLIKSGAIVLAGIFVLMVIASGSREGFIIMVALTGSWFFFGYRKVLIQKPHIGIIVLVLFMGLMVFMFRQLSDTLLSERMQDFITILKGGSGDDSAMQRIDMIKKGVAMTFRNPVVGVGLNQFVLVGGYGKYAHNNYVEIFVSTGFIGGFLFYAIYVVLFFRLMRLSKYPLTRREFSLITIGKAIMVMKVLSEMARVSYYLKINWVIIAIFIGYTYYLENNYRLFFAEQKNHSGVI